MTRTFLHKSIIFQIGILCLAISSAQAGNLYVYRDAEGSALLTNKKMNTGSFKQEKVTYYPDTNVHSYNNWGKSEASVLPSFSKSKDNYDHIIRSAAQTYGVSEGLVKAIMHTESSFNVNARSPVGAQGLMQLMPATARRFNVSDAYDPTQNIHGGAKYLSWLLKRFKGNTQLALAAYNAGEGNVDKYNGIPPFRETQDYVRRVMSRYQNLYSGGLNLGGSNSFTANSSIQSGSSDNSSSNNNATSNNNTDNAKSLSTSSNYTPSSSKREIVYSNGVYTDRASTRTYATDDAIVTSNIQISAQ